MGRHTNNVDRCIGQRIREARKALGMSQTILAEQLGLTFQQVQKYEMGYNRVSSATLLKIANFLDKPIVWFYGDHLNRVAKPSKEADALLNECEVLLKELRGTDALPAIKEAMTSALKNALS